MTRRSAVQVHCIRETKLEKYYRPRTWVMLPVKMNRFASLRFADSRVALVSSCLQTKCISELLLLCFSQVFGGSCGCPAVQGALMRLSL